MLYVYILFLIILLLLVLYYVLAYHTFPVFIRNNQRIDFDKVQATTDIIICGFYSENYKNNYIELEKSFFKTNKGIISFIHVDQESMNQCFRICPKFGVLNKFTGCSVKQHIISKIITENIGKYVLFCEADVLILKPIDKLISYYANANYDIVFGNYLLWKIGNINYVTPLTGVMLMKCTSLLADTIKNMCNEIEKQCAWDELLMIEGLINGKFKYTFFPVNYVSNLHAINQESMIIKFVDVKDKLLEQRIVSKRLLGI
jgi:hypothetical protein